MRHIGSGKLQLQPQKLNLNDAAGQEHHTLLIGRAAGEHTRNLICSFLLSPEAASAASVL
jgi:hypothetical protein